MPKITIDENVCKGCGLCAAVCPKHIIDADPHTINRKGYHPAAVTDMDQCIACASCAKMCPDSIITIEKD